MWNGTKKANNRKNQKLLAGVLSGILMVPLTAVAILIPGGILYEVAIIASLASTSAGLGVASAVAITLSKSVAIQELISNAAERIMNTSKSIAEEIGNLQEVNTINVHDELVNLGFQPGVLPGDFCIEDKLDIIVEEAESVAAEEKKVALNKAEELSLAKQKLDSVTEKASVQK